MFLSTSEEKSSEAMYASSLERKQLGDIRLTSCRRETPSLSISTSSILVPFQRGEMLSSFPSIASYFSLHVNKLEGKGGIFAGLAQCASSRKHERLIARERRAQLGKSLGSRECFPREDCVEMLKASDEIIQVDGELTASSHFCQLCSYFWNLFQVKIN